MRRTPRGFIILFGTRSMISDDPAGAVETVCPHCNRRTWIRAKTYRNWFTLFFIPVFPISTKTRFSQCATCGAQFQVSIEELKARLAEGEAQQSQQAITLYNSLRTSPGNSVTLNELLHLYGSLKEYDQAISAAAEFEPALQSSEQCMTSLGRIYLAKDQHEQAIEWFDAALAKNADYGEAAYYKAIAHLSATPPEYEEAIAAARIARKTGYPGADGLLREAEEKART
jgi:tetratricopeptide (TPR) repeat protein